MFQNVSVAENAEKKFSIKLYHNKYFYGNFNSNFSLQNKQLQHIKKVFFLLRINSVIERKLNYSFSHFFQFNLKKLNNYVERIKKKWEITSIEIFFSLIWKNVMFIFNFWYIQNQSSKRKGKILLIVLYWCFILFEIFIKNNFLSAKRISVLCTFFVNFNTIKWPKFSFQFISLLRTKLQYFPFNLN